MDSSSSTPFLPRPPNIEPLSSREGYTTYEDDDNNVNKNTNLTIPRSMTPPKRPRITLYQFLIHAFAIWGLISLVSQTYNLLLDSDDSTSSCPAASKSQTPDVYRPSTLPASLSPICYCGNNPTEARLLYNCTYDTLSTAWLPPYCRDEALTAEFDRSGPGPDNSWPYFADPAGKVPLTVEQVASMGGTSQRFWAHRRWHIVHCLFYWQKHWRMRHTGKTMEERFDDIDHVRHCIRLILNPEPGPGHLFLIQVPVKMNSSYAAGEHSAIAIDGKIVEGHGVVVGGGGGGGHEHND